MQRMAIKIMTLSIFPLDISHALVILSPVSANT